MVIVHKKDEEELPYPSILVIPSYETLVSENIAFYKKLNPKYEVDLENDDFKLVFEAFAYRELHLRAMINNKIKNMMPQYAKASDLDSFVFAFYGGVKRLRGAYPYASFRFTLQNGETLTLPNGSIVSNNKNQKGRLREDVHLSLDAPAVVAMVELLEHVEQSETELNILNDFYNVKVEQLTAFKNGATTEDDERFRKRALLSINRFSTAGARDSYYYHIMDLDVRVDTVYVYSPSPGVVKIVLDNFFKKIDDDVVKKIEQHLSSDKLRPITDKVEVVKAKNIAIKIKANIELFDLSSQISIDAKIQNSFKEPFKISEDLTLSDVVQRLHITGVYAVEMISPKESLIVGDESRIVIEEVSCVYSRANV